jgi:TolA-binding protein
MRGSRCGLGLSAILCVAIAAAQSTTEPTESPTLTATQVYRDALETLSSGDQRGAETILRQAVQTFPRDSRLVFFAAACMRSQWNLSTAALYFRRVGQLDPDGIWGKASNVILDLDGASEQKDKELKALDELSQANLDEPLLMWMVAVECRQQNSNELGVQRYATLLKQWKPGPAMAHQTYANMLDELHRYPDSLLERRLAVQLEPASWTYESLGNTLSQLGNWKEADAAYQAASERSPMSAEVWENWTWSMKARGDKHGQEEKAVMWHWAQQANYDIRDRRARLANATATTPHPHSPQAINLYNSVCAHWLENQLSLANSDLRTGMDRFPSDARFPLFLGTSFLANRQYDQARQMLRLAVDTEPTGLAGRTADYLVTMENPLERVANFRAICCGFAPRRRCRFTRTFPLWPHL